MTTNTQQNDNTKQTEDVLIKRALYLSHELESTNENIDNENYFSELIYIMETLNAKSEAQNRR